MSDEYTFAWDGGETFLRRSPNRLALRASRRTGSASLDAMARRGGAIPVGRLDRFSLYDFERELQDEMRAPAQVSSRFGADEVASVYFTSDDEVPFVPDGTITVGFRDGSRIEEVEAVIDRYGLSHLRMTRDGDCYVFAIADNDLDTVALAQVLHLEEVVRVAQPNLTTPAEWMTEFPDDRLLDRQWHLRNTGQHNGTTTNYKAGADARVVAAWRRLGNLGSQDVIVGVIDDGFDLSHPDLKGKWVAPWDFIRSGTDVSPAPSLDDHEAGDWHGTPCAGVAVGGAAGGDTLGVAPNARLMPVRMQKVLNPKYVADWFDHMTDNGAWIVSCSWGAEAAYFMHYVEINKAIARCAREGRDGKGCVVVFAAGNNKIDINDHPNTLNSLAIHPDVLAVSASTSRDLSANYSNFGAEIAVCAPSSGGRHGWRVTTIDATGHYTDAQGESMHRGTEAGDYTHLFTGTSCSCPIVAGVCALVLSANPDLTAAEVRQIIRDSAREIGSDEPYPDGHLPRYGHGCVNADEAVGLALASRAEMLIARAQAPTGTG